MKRKCPKCGRKYTEHPALSRIDNETEICPQCGGLEAMAAVMLNERKKENNTDLSNVTLKCPNPKCGYVFNGTLAERCVGKFGGIYWGCPKCYSIARKIKQGG